jgi:hypothetical protein
VGAGLVFGGVGGGLLLDAQSLDSDANRDPNQSESNALRSKADTRRLLGGVLGVGGLALLVTGGIKLAIHPTAKNRAVVLVPSANGFEVRGVF